MTSEFLESDLVGTPPAGDESPEDYMSNDQSAGVSEETGTIYDGQGEAEVTPHDLERPTDEDEDE